MYGVVKQFIAVNTYTKGEVAAVCLWAFLLGPKIPGFFAAKTMKDLQSNLLLTVVNAGDDDDDDDDDDDPPSPNPPPDDDPPPDDNGPAGK